MNQSDSGAERFEAWREALVDAVRRVDPHVRDDLGYGTVLSYRLGGPDPLGYVHTYPRDLPRAHWLYFSAGFSEPNDDDPPGQSGYGFELTLRVPRDPAEGDIAPASYVVALQSLGRYVFSTGNVITAGDYLEASGLGLDIGVEAFAAIDDPEIAPVETPRGTIAVLALVALDRRELDAVKAWSTTGFIDAAVAAGKLVKPFVLEPGRPSTLEDPAFAAVVAEGGAREGSRTGVLFILNLAIETKPRLLRGPLHEIRFTADEATTIASVLPNRIGFERKLSLVGNGVSLRFEPAATAAFREDGGYVLELPKSAADALASAIRRGETSVEIPGVPVRIAIVASASR